METTLGIGDHGAGPGYQSLLSLVQLRSIPASSPTETAACGHQASVPDQTSALPRIFKVTIQEYISFLFSATFWKVLFLF